MKSVNGGADGFVTKGCGDWGYVMPYSFDPARKIYTSASSAIRYDSFCV